MKKVITIVGARPQFIKAAAVSRAIRDISGIREIIIHSGQHFDNNMSSVFFKEMDIPRPEYNLKINSLSHGAMTGRMMEKIEEILLTVNPDMVLVYGDTNTTLAGALAAKKLIIPVSHVESGLRSFNMNMPEEINRILTDRISDFLFCPTENAVHNLHREGFQNFGCNIIHVGDVMYDAALYYSSLSSERSDIIRQLNLREGNFAVCTIHRQENTDNLDHLKSIIKALNQINQYQKIVLPLHPRTRKIMETNNITTGFPVIDPLGYFDMLELLKKCALVLTDSGGMQKEAFFFSKFCITMRDETEWTELVENKYNYLTGPHEEAILNAWQKIRSATFIPAHQFYGNGDASQKIARTISA